MKQIIYIEGSIGAGKTTIIEQIKQLCNSEFKHLRVMFIPEPLEIWSQYADDKGKSILELFYNNKKQYSLKFQLILLKSLVDQFRLIDDKYDIIIVERSVISQRKIFVQQFMNTDIMDCLDTKIYEQYRDDLWNPIQNKLQQQGFTFKHVYVRTDANIAQQRIKKRNRTGEQDISIEYLTDLETLHDQWLLNKGSTISYLLVDNNADSQLPINTISDIMKF